MKKNHLISVLFFCVLFLSGCASSRSGSAYTRDEARRPLEVSFGKVLQVNPVTIEGTKTPAGTVLGGATGAAVGSAIGSGTGRTIATVLGGVAGVLLGSAIEEGVTARPGVEITVEMDNGRIIAVVQEADAQFTVGDRVRLVQSSDGTMRVRQ